MGQASRTQELLGRLAGQPHQTLQLGLGRVLLVAPPETAAQPQGQLLTHFAVNLIARLFPVVKLLDVAITTDHDLDVFIPRWQEATLRKSVERMLTELAPLAATRVIDNIPVPDAYDCIATVGRPASFPANIIVGSTGWIAQVSTTEMLAVGGPPNPVGAYAAACFGAAQVWNRLLAPYREQLPSLPLLPLDGTLSFSCFDYRHDTAGPNPSLPEQVHVRRVTIVGLGAGGGATTYTLASLSSLNGTFTLVEPDEITDTGLNRAVAANAADAAAARPKVDLYTELLDSHLGATVRPLQMPFDKAIALLAPEDWERVVAAVHSREARRAIQMETPRTIWDAGATETGEFWVWRVLFGQSECLACRFREGGSDPERAKALQLTQVLGLTQDDWLAKLRNNAQFT
jgi:molybdopterin/thiamine biosynthesis adenylyltransferase